MGYTGEEMQAGVSILNRLAGAIAGRSDLPAVEWTRHGILPVIYDAPFLVAAMLFPDTVPWQDRLVAWRPILLTAALTTLLFIWIWRVTRRPAWSLTVALLGLFSTMLWPYAYIGLEDTQSFFLLLAGYLALESQPFQSWAKTLAFALSAGCAISSKSTGAFLIPAVGFLAVVAFYKSTERKTLRFVVLTLVVAFIFVISSLSRLPFWNANGGTQHFLLYWLIGDPFYFFANLVSFFFSINKGLFVYSPILLLAAIQLARMSRERRDLAVFAFLTAVGLACGFSLLRVWSDETWCARYLHSCVAPLLVGLGIGFSSKSQWSRVSFAATAVFGFVVALLGCSFQYGFAHAAMTEAGQDTLEAMQGDVIWNPIRFNARLFWIAWNGTPAPVTMDTKHQWYYAVPSPPVIWKTVEISKYAVPQPYMIRLWRAKLVGTRLWYRWATEVALIIGTILLLTSVALVRRIQFEVLEAKSEDVGSKMET